MKLEQLRALQAVVTAGTFRGASVAMHKSQPAVSQLVRALENEIGLTLISRDNYRPTLTPAGEIFYRKAQALLLQMQELSNLAEKFSGQQEPEIRISVTATCPLSPLLDVIGKVGRSFPSTDIRLTTDVMGGSAEKLMSGKAQVIIATLDGLSLDMLETIPYTCINIIPVARPSYGPVRSASLLTATDMSDYVQVIVTGTGQGSFEQTRDVLPNSLRWTVSDFAAKKEIILAGMGWGGMPEHLVRKELDTGELIQLQIPEFPLRRSHIHAIRRRDHAFGVVASELWLGLSNDPSLPL